MNAARDERDAAVLSGRALPVHEALSRILAALLRIEDRLVAEPAALTPKAAPRKAA